MENSSPAIETFLVEAEVAIECQSFLSMLLKDKSSEHFCCWVFFRIIREGEHIVMV
ncbi:hypothetical protein QUA54_23975 [Microcoleus sp. MOSTC5]|uniref:hypothetical protein n=1 Tax=Microcoleus sp. MOSTC5 TaxID=3055378 RepID=UPI002FD75BC4